jgi:phosphonate transport system substrate-binding protein
VSSYRRGTIDRRLLLAGFGGLLASRARAQAPLRFALTPVLITSDLVMLEELKGCLARTMGRPVHLVTRRTYQEITALLVSRQVEGPRLI